MCQRIPTLEALLEKRENEFRSILNEYGADRSEAHKLARAMQNLKRYTGKWALVYFLVQELTKTKFYSCMKSCINEKKKSSEKCFAEREHTLYMNKMYIFMLYILGCHFCSIIVINEVLYVLFKGYYAFYHNFERSQSIFTLINRVCFCL